MSPTISIILAVYNGGQYLSAQIESIFAQSYKNWQLIIRDDGSCDNTLDVVNEWAQRYPEKIRLITGGDWNIGVSQNFLSLLSYVDTDYVMFCDQDDVWLPDKIIITLEQAKETEKRYGVNMPVLIHTDLKVADKNLNVIACSFWKYQNLNPEKGRSLNRLLVQNVITGCTVMINKALREKIKLLPEQTIMYDWWIALIAAAFGKIDYVPTTTMLYRQHDKNDIGAKEWKLGYIMNMIRLKRSNLKLLLQKPQQQARAFLDIFREELTERHIGLLAVYSTLDQQSFSVKRLNLIKYRFFKIGLTKNIGLFLYI